MQRRTFLLGASAATSVTLLAACKRRGSSSDQTIRVAQWGQEKYLIYLPFYIAQEAGLFDRRELKIELSFSGNDDQVFASVLRGDAQFGIGDPIFAAISRNRGGDGVVVGQIVDKVALWGVSKPGGKKRTRPLDFAGARIGTFPRPSTTYTLVRQMIDANQVEGATILEVPIGSELGLLEQDGADVVMLLEPAASAAVEAGYEIVTSFPQLWGPFAFTGLTAEQSYVTANPQVVSKMKSALQDSLNLAHSAPDRAIAIAEKLFPALDRGVVGDAVRRMISDQTVPISFDVSPEGWAAAVRIRQAMGELQSGDDYVEVLV